MIVEVLVVHPAYSAVLVIRHRDIQRAVYWVHYAYVTPAQFIMLLESFLPHFLYESLILFLVLHLGIRGNYIEVLIGTLMVLV